MLCVSLSVIYVLFIEGLQCLRDFVSNDVCILVSNHVEVVLFVCSFVEVRRCVKIRVSYLPSYADYISFCLYSIC